MRGWLAAALLTLGLTGCVADLSGSHRYYPMPDSDGRLVARAGEPAMLLWQSGPVTMGWPLVRDSRLYGAWRHPGRVSPDLVIDDGVLSRRIGAEWETLTYEWLGSDLLVMQTATGTELLQMIRIEDAHMLLMIWLTATPPSSDRVERVLPNG